jgi:hypothetical protein
MKDPRAGARATTLARKRHGTSRTAWSATAASLRVHLHSIPLLKVVSNSVDGAAAPRLELNRFKLISNQQITRHGD